MTAVVYDATPIDRDDWLDWRRDGLGGSDLPPIVGLSPWASPLSVYLDKTGQTTVDHESELMEFGRRAETMVNDWFHDRTGLYVVGAQTRATDSDRPWRRATLDGFAAETADATPVDALALVEVKTTGERTEDRWAERVPAMYQVQVQWQLGITGHERAILAVLHGRLLRTYEIARDDEAIAWLDAKAAEFWQRVIDRDPPPADAHPATTAALADAYGRVPDDEKTVDIDALADALAALRAVKSERRQLDERADGLENRIKAALGDAPVGLVAGTPAVTWRPVNNPRVHNCPDCAHKRDVLPRRLHLPTPKETAA